jgi:glycopeptide antibiotics resistance protein
MSLRRVPFWGWWILVVFFVSAPWTGFTGEAQWDRLYLRPFSDPEDTAGDFIANMALFVPFGYSFFRHARAGHRLALTLAAASAVSLCAEAPQLFSTLRNPSATDVTAALAGSMAGALWRLRQEKAGR